MRSKNRKTKVQMLKTTLGWLFFFLLLGALGTGGVVAKELYQRDSKVAVNLDKTEAIKKGDVLVLSFSSPMLKRSVEQGLSIEPRSKLQGWWSGSQELNLKITEPLRPETNYRIKLAGTKTKWLLPQRDLYLNFQTPKAPAIQEVYPQNGQQDVDFSQSIKVKFDSALGEDYTAQVLINPLVKVNSLLDETQKELTVVPEEQLKENTEYRVQVKLANKYFPETDIISYTGVFNTRKPVEQVTYMMDASGNPVRTEPVKEKAEASIKDGKYVDINLRTQILRIFENGAEKGAYKISSGKRAMPTPEGQFKILVKARRPFSKDYGLYMPWFLGFTNLGHGIHELPEWPGGYKEGASHLGTPVSHGCVRLGVGPAKIVYDFVDVGTPLVIHR